MTWVLELWEVTALTPAFIMAAIILKDLQHPLLMPGVCHQCKQRRIIAEQAPCHMPQHRIVWQTGRLAIAGEQQLLKISAALCVSLVQQHG